MMSTFTLVQAIKPVSKIPVIAAGGIMDAAGITAILGLGATGTQLGTAFILYPESSASPAYRAAIKSQLAQHTVLTSVISGRPARSFNNAFCQMAQDIAEQCIPPYPLAYDLGQAVASAAVLKGEYGFSAQWAGQGASLASELPAQQLIAILTSELSQ